MLKATIASTTGIGLLQRFVSDRGKIPPRRQTGTCAKHQRRLTVAIKRARHIALLPFVAELDRWRTYHEPSGMKIYARCVY